jgi:transcriptional regulator with XRE-family HTH domain
MRDIQIAVRAHTRFTPFKPIKKKDPSFSEGKSDKKKSSRKLPIYGKRVMILDTETRIDTRQNLTIGQAWIFEGEEQAYREKKPRKKYIFHADDLPLDELEILTNYAKAEKLIQLSKTEFIETVFYPEIWKRYTLLVCFNQPFDLSRLAIDAEVTDRGEYKDRFKLFLSTNERNPHLLVKPIDSKKSFIEFHGSYRNHFKGRFLDLRRLVFALVNESHTLKSAAKKFHCEHQKQEFKEHGVVTQEALEYNTNDLWVTWDLYCETKREFDKHPVLNKSLKPLEAGSAFSSASIGIGYLRKMGIKPFAEKQPDFPPEVLGYAMAAYLGGRSECHIRRMPVEVFHTDIASMYPSCSILQGLWNWTTAKKLYVTEEKDRALEAEKVLAWVTSLTLEKLFKPETWKELPGLVLIRPKDHLLPVRGDFSTDTGYQIGLNYLTVSDDVLKAEKTKGLWYTLADVVACWILTGKIPEILEAIRIIPSHAKQNGLQPVMLRGEPEVHPRDDFFKKLIEMRMPIKHDPEKHGLQTFLKTVGNSVVYGKYVENNREPLPGEGRVDCFGLSHITPKQDDEWERPGDFYNPLIAVMITGGARLILAMMQKSVEYFGGTFAFCDTDSMSIADLSGNTKHEQIGREVIEKFKGLVPYDKTIVGEDFSLLEAEGINWRRKNWEIDEDDNNLDTNIYHPLYCFMISAKRYAMYNLIIDEQGNTQIIIRKKSDHGFGHLMSPIESNKRTDFIEEIWKYHISREHNLPYQCPDWFKTTAFSQLTISKPSYYKAFNKDKNLPYADRIKPFNFMRVAYPDHGLRRYGNDTLQEFLCEKKERIGKIECSNKSKCEYKETCLANSHVYPFAPYASGEELTGFDKFESEALDKTTGESLSGKLKQSDTRCSQHEDMEIEQHLRQNRQKLFPCLKDCEFEKRLLEEIVKHKNWEAKNSIFDLKDKKIFLKNYFDFVCQYTKHPEAKYDEAATGEICKPWTKGLLKPTRVNITSIIHIGKEAETIQDEEEELILPDETRDHLKIYHRISKVTVQQLRKEALNNYESLPEVEMIKHVRKAGLKLASLADYGKETINELMKRFPGMIRKNGNFAVDEAAQVLGFESSNDFVDRLKKIPSKDEAIQSYIDDYCKYADIDLEKVDWEYFRSKLGDALKEKNITQKQFADLIGKSEDHVNALIRGRYFPPSYLQTKIVEICAQKKILILEGKEPKPKDFRDDPYPICKLNKIAAQLDKETMNVFRDRFGENGTKSIFVFHQNELVYKTPEVLEYVKIESDRLRKKKLTELAQEGRNLTITVIDYSTGTRVLFEVDEIVETRLMRENGNCYIQGRFKDDDKFYTVYQNQNKPAFNKHIFPEPYKEFEKAKENNDFIPPKKKQRFPKIYSNPKPFVGEWMSIESAQYQYQVKRIDPKSIPEKFRMKKNDQWFVNSLFAWKYFGLG